MTGRTRTTKGAARRDPVKNRERILGAALAEFSRHGLGGARVDRIAARARANKRMLYYYFGSKDDLFLAVLEASYAQIRSAERALDLEHLDPRAALERLVEFTWEYLLAHPEFTALLNSENLHKGRHVAASCIRRWSRCCAGSSSAARNGGYSGVVSIRLSSTSRSPGKATFT